MKELSIIELIELINHYDLQSSMGRGRWMLYSSYVVKLLKELDARTEQLTKKQH
jgi:hypothetical protein